MNHDSDGRRIAVTGFKTGSLRSAAQAYCSSLVDCYQAAPRCLVGMSSLLLSVKYLLALCLVSALPLRLSCSTGIGLGARLNRHP